MTPEAFRALLEAKGCKPKDSPGGWVNARCPAHDDRRESFGYAVNSEGAIGLKCQAGCTSQDIVEALGIRMRDLFPDKEEKEAPREVAVYVYTDKAGKPDVEVVRFEPKTFKQRLPGAKTFGLGGHVCVYPYHVVALANAAAFDGEAWVMEGEKDVEAAERLGLAATCNLGGAGAWHDDYAKHFAGLSLVYVVADKDPLWKWTYNKAKGTGSWKAFAVGQKHAVTVARSLAKVASVRVVEMPDVEGRDVKDVADAVAAGYTKDKLQAWAAGHSFDVEEYAENLVERIEAAKPARLDSRKEDPKDEHKKERDAKTASVKMSVEDLDQIDTDLAAAHRFQAMFGSEVRYCGARNTWFVWDGRRWAIDVDNVAEKLAGKSARAYTVRCLDRTEKEITAAKRMEARNRIVGALAQARSLDGIATPASVFDACDDLLTVRNGTVNLRTGDLLPHDREHYITHLVDVDYDPEAKAPRFMQFLDEIHPGQPEVTEFLRRWIGYCLTGETREHKFLVAVGEGRNGKSVLFEAISRILGTTLAGPAPRGLLMMRKFEGHPVDLASLRGQRLVTVSEVDGGESFGAARVKWLTGGDTIKARGMRENFTDFRSTHKFCIYLNDLPEVNDSSTAFWERVRVVTFGQQFVGEKCDPDLSRKLMAEDAGILAWAVSGAIDWYDGGLTSPEEVDLASMAYRNEADDVRRWIEDSLLDTVSDREQLAKAHFDSYETWCSRNGGRSMSMKAFAGELKRHKCSKRKTKRGMEWTLPTLEVLLAERCRVQHSAEFSSSPRNARPDGAFISLDPALPCTLHPLVPGPSGQPEPHVADGCSVVDAKRDVPVASIASAPKTMSWDFDDEDEAGSNHD